jgi:hypothetical protein
MNPTEPFTHISDRIPEPHIRGIADSPTPVASASVAQNRKSAPFFPRGNRSAIFHFSMFSTTQTARCLLHCILLLPGIAALGLSLSGCTGHKTFIPPVFYDSPEAGLQALAAVKLGEQAVTSIAKIEINHQGNHYPLKAAVMMKRPAFLRVESIPLMGPPDLYLSVVKDKLRVFLPEKGAFYTGSATPRNISRFFPVFMPATDMISLLMGVPPEDAEEMQSLDGKQEEGLYRIDQYKSGWRERSLWIDPADGRLTRFQRFMEEGRLMYTADFADHVRIGKGLLPQEVTIRIEEMAVLHIHYTDLQTFDAGPESFPLQIPEGMTPILLDP